MQRLAGILSALVRGVITHPFESPSNVNAAQWASFHKACHLSNVYVPHVQHVELSIHKLIVNQYSVWLSLAV